MNFGGYTKPTLGGTVLVGGVLGVQQKEPKAPFFGTPDHDTCNQCVIVVRNGVLQDASLSQRTSMSVFMHSTVVVTC